MVEGLRERRVITRFGDMTIGRRLYRDRRGEWRFLPDEAPPPERRSPPGSGVRELCLLLASLLTIGNTLRKPLNPGAKR